MMPLRLLVVLVLFGPVGEIVVVGVEDFDGGVDGRLRGGVMESAPGPSSSTYHRQVLLRVALMTRFVRTLALNVAGVVFILIYAHRWILGIYGVVPVVVDTGRNRGCIR